MTTAGSERMKQGLVWLQDAIAEVLLPYCCKWRYAENEFDTEFKLVLRMAPDPPERKECLPLGGVSLCDKLVRVTRWVPALFSYWKQMRVPQPKYHFRGVTTGGPKASEMFRVELSAQLRCSGNARDMAEPVNQ